MHSCDIISDGILLFKTSCSVLPYLSTRYHNLKIVNALNIMSRIDSEISLELDYTKTVHGVNFVTQALLIKHQTLSQIATIILFSFYSPVGQSLRFQNLG